MKCDISVIVPVYNSEKYLHDCIESIINQKYKNLEIILVNDGSTDDSLLICNEYEKNDPRVVVIDKENGGVSSARNRGLEAAKGEYVSFVDSDDIISNDLYFDVVNTILKENPDIVTFCLKKSTTRKNLKYEKSDNIEILTKDEAMRNILLGDNIENYPVNKVFKRKLFNDIKFPEGKNFEDFGTIYKLISKSRKVVNIRNEYYFYYLRNDGITGNMSEKTIQNRVDLSVERFEFIEKNYPCLQKENIIDRLYNIYRIHMDCCKYLNDSLLYNSDVIKEQYEFFKKNYFLLEHRKIGYAILFFNRNLFYTISSNCHKFRRLVVRK